MSNELDATDEGNARTRWRRVGAEAIKCGSIPAISGFANIVMPGSGVLVSSIFAMFAGAWSAKATEKANAGFSEVFKRLESKIKDVEDASATLEFIFSEEYLAELRQSLETISKAEDDEKVEAAINLAVNIGIGAGKDKTSLKNIVAGFVRDATPIEIRVLMMLAPFGTYRTDAENPDWTVEDILSNLLGVLGVVDDVDKGVVYGAVGRLRMLGLCVAQGDFGAGIVYPIQRTPLGDQVVLLLTKK